MSRGSGRGPAAEDDAHQGGARQHRHQQKGLVGAEAVGQRPKEERPRAHGQPGSERAAGRRQGRPSEKAMARATLSG